MKVSFLTEILRISFNKFIQYKKDNKKEVKIINKKQKKNLEETLQSLKDGEYLMLSYSSSEEEQDQQKVDE
ncbi:MAG: hypothetical protein ACFFAO_01500 [Candidatus Hermodarchaeota archaeon]